MTAFIYVVLWVMTFQAGAITGKLDDQLYQSCDSQEQVNCWKRAPSNVAPVAMNDEANQSGEIPAADAAKEK